MTIEEAIIESLRDLPPDKQQEVLDFARFLRQQAVAPPPQRQRSIKGLWAGVDITDEDIAEVRREM